MKRAQPGTDLHQLQTVRPMRPPGMRRLRPVATTSAMHRVGLDGRFRRWLAPQDGAGPGRGFPVGQVAQSFESRSRSLSLALKFQRMPSWLRWPLDPLGTRSSYPHRRSAIPRLVVHVMRSERPERAHFIECCRPHESQLFRRDLKNTSIPTLSEDAASTSTRCPACGRSRTSLHQNAKTAPTLNSPVPSTSMVPVLRRDGQRC